MPGSPNGGFLCSRWRGKLSRHSWRMLNLQFYVSGKIPMESGRHPAYPGASEKTAETGAVRCGSSYQIRYVFLSGPKILGIYRGDGIFVTMRASISKKCTPTPSQRSILVLTWAQRVSRSATAWMQVSDDFIVVPLILRLIWWNIATIKIRARAFNIKVFRHLAPKQASSAHLFVL